MANKTAVALRAFNSGEDRFQKDAVIEGLPLNQFSDWSAPGVDLVREATAADKKGADPVRPTTD